jgi:hypothetical protein
LSPLRRPYPPSAVQTNLVSFVACLPDFPWRQAWAAYLTPRTLKAAKAGFISQVILCAALTCARSTAFPCISAVDHAIRLNGERPSENRCGIHLVLRFAPVQ